VFYSCHNYATRSRPGHAGAPGLAVRDDVAYVARKRQPGQHLKQIAADFGIRESRLTNWTRVADVEEGAKPGTTAAENADLREARKRIAPWNS
jgi:hypothetical protein